MEAKEKMTNYEKQQLIEKELFESTYWKPNIKMIAKVLHVTAPTVKRVFDYMKKNDKIDVVIQSKKELSEAEKND